ncbi:Nuclear pore complex protein Nup85 [Halotydeus destructor]|nr:Nuclear pore complex protein Nup85 [Halotydeus destructor]
MSSLAFPVPLKDSPATILSAEWGSGDKLLVYMKPREPTQQPSPSSQNANPSVSLLRWRADLFAEPATRAMISESASLFEEIGQTNGAVPAAELVKISRRYRAIIHAALSGLQDEDLWGTFHEIEITWHLCEVLFIDFHAPGVLINQLLSWIRWNYPELNDLAESVLAHKSPHEHPSYWNVVYGFVLRGQNENARTFLKLSPDAKKNEEFTIATQLLHEMPVFTSGQMTHEFDMRWQKWSDDCNEILRSGLFDNHEKLRNVVRILSGDDDVFREFSEQGHLWFQLMIAQLLYKDPFIKDKDLGSLADDFLSSYGFRERSIFDRVLVACFSYDLMEVLREACYYSDNWWFVSHFVDLLHRGKQLADHQVEDGDKLRESLLLDYADGLMSHSSLWQVSFNYYDSCFENGRQRLQLLLDRLPIENEKKALKVIEMAGKRNLDSVCRSVSRVLAASYLKRNRHAQALLWALRSQDCRLCTHIANIFLDTYVSTGSFPDPDVLSSLGSSMLVSERLTFLAKYFEFQQLKKDGLFSEAGSLLVQLISSHISPKNFLMTLLMDSLPLLQSDQLILNSEQTVQVMVSLEELLDSKVSFVADSNSDAAKAFQEKEDTLRLALARNIGRSFIV